MAFSLGSLFKGSSKKNVPLEEQLGALAECGIRLRQGVTVSNLLERFDRKFYEAGPYKRLLPILGEPFMRGRLSDDILLLDTECVSGNGSYVNIVTPMTRMTRGAVLLTDVRDSLDDAKAGSWVQFRLNGRTTRWAVDRDAEWIDPVILARLAALLAQRTKAIQYVFCSPGGQTALIACCTPEETTRLNLITGMEFKALTNPDQAAAPIEEPDAPNPE